MPTLYRETERLRLGSAGRILAVMVKTDPFRLARLGGAMKFLFDDESFSFETLRAAGFADYGGADLGEVLSTARHIGEGDEASWHRAWKATAQRVAEIGEQALASGHRVSAREALLRASNYYRTADFFLRENPASDPEVTLLSTRSRETFATAAGLFDTPVEAVSIPYEGTTLPGYLYLVDDSSTPRPTVVYNSGYDSTLEESYYAIAAAALRRGYNVLAFDGPGQGAALREQKLVMRPDWEAVITPVVDFALTRGEIAADRIVLFGYSLGGFLVARAAAFEHRVAALILDDGIHDFHAAFARSMPPFMGAWIEEGRDDVAIPVLTMLTHVNTQVRWALRNGMWVFGADSFADLIRRARDYTLDGVAHQIVAPTLILDPENDQFLKGQPQLVEKALTGARTTLVTLTENEGAGEHCHMGAMFRAHQVIFDWLDTTLGAA
jgi:pimeloyl-ACP methyl ester carboxylesterase